MTAVEVDLVDPPAGARIVEVAEPEPPAGWVTVEVRSASLNHHDIWTLRGATAARTRLPMVLGCDAAGVTGDGREVIVHGVIAPDGRPLDGQELLSRRFSMLSERHHGTFAERVAVPAQNLVDKPASLTFEEAACLPTAYLTAYRALFVKAALKAGDSVLIQGAGGGFATAALLLAKAAGIEVTIVSRSALRRSRALDLGAERALAPGADFEEPVDAVLESVGGAAWSDSLAAVKPEGRIVVVGSTAGDVRLDLARVFYRQVAIVGSLMGTRAELVALLELLDRSGTRPLIDTVIALVDGCEALARMYRGEHFGKLVLRP